MPVIFPRFVADRGQDFGRLLSRVGIRSPHLAEMWRAYSSLAGAENRKAFVRTIRGVIEPGGQTVSALDRLYLAAHLPTLIVWGDRDPIIPVKHASVAHEAIPKSQLAILDGVGHFPHVEAPERFLLVLTEFLESTSAEPRSPVRLHDLLRFHRQAS